MAWRCATGVERVDLVERHGVMVREAGSWVRRVDRDAHRADWRRAERIIVENDWKLVMELRCIALCGIEQMLRRRS
jgi:hypothetical protein